MTTAGQSRIMDRWAEGVLQTVIEIAPKIKENQNDYDVMADYMLSATLALNSMISMGVTQDWATHMERLSRNLIFVKQRIYNPAL